MLGSVCRLRIGLRVQQIGGEEDIGAGRYFDLGGNIFVQKLQEMNYAIKQSTIC